MLYALHVSLKENPGDWWFQASSAALSIGSNWVEGIGKRGTPKAELAAWRHARGSGYELAFQLDMVGLDMLTRSVDELCDLMDRYIDDAVRSLEDFEGTPVKKAVAP